jgi:GNAT superfamily N-acetyltransferase
MTSIARALKIRDARLPDDKPAILRFIMGLQQFEKKIEPDRRTDEGVAEEFYEVLLHRLKERDGRIFIAEEHGARVGWAQVHEEDNQIYVVPEERRFGHIAELYVDEAARGRGIGRALIAACEDWARERGLKLVTIGALAGNARAYGLYQASGYAPYVIELRKYLR